MKNSPPIVRLVAMSALAALLLNACASERVNAENKKAKENKDDYVDYYPVGSNIPIKIPKDQAKTTEKETEASQQAMRNVQRTGSTSPSGN